eukprot:gene16550-18813_t
MKVKALHAMYNEYYTKHNISIQAFCRNMRGIGFEYKANGDGYNIYDISLGELQQIAKTKKWLHVLDNDIIEQYKQDDEECMFVDKAVYVRAEDHKIVTDKLENMKEK